MPKLFITNHPYISSSSLSASFLSFFFINREQPEIDPFSFLLPGLVNLTVDEDVREDFMRAGGHIKLLKCMQHETAQLQQQSTQFGPLISCLGILMNLLCLDEPAVFSSLHNNPVAFLPVLFQITSLANTEQMDQGNENEKSQETEKAIVQAHAIAASFFIIRSVGSQEAISKGLREITAGSIQGGGLELGTLFAGLTKQLFKLFISYGSDQGTWPEISDLWLLAMDGKLQSQCGATVTHRERLSSVFLVHVCSFPSFSRLVWLTNTLCSFCAHSHEELHWQLPHAKRHVAFVTVVGQGCRVCSREGCSPRESSHPASHHRNREKINNI